MKGIFAACAVLLALTSEPARGQSAAPVFDWSGFYIGGTVGGGWGKTHLTGQFPWDFHTDGFAGGIEAGYNWQNGPWVLGLETDLSAGGISETFSPPVTPLDCDPGCSVKTQWFGTTRARIGYALGNFLPYVTGGIAYARLHGDYANFKPFTESGSATRTSAVVGAGLEWAIDRQWSAKIEYLHFDFGSFIFTEEFARTFGPGYGEASIRFDTVRIGINYRFGTR